MYDEKVSELEEEQAKLSDMFANRISIGAPLTDVEIINQNEHCGEIGLKIMKLKEMLDKAEEEE